MRCSVGCELLPLARFKRPRTSTASLRTSTTVRSMAAAPLSLVQCPPRVLRDFNRLALRSFAGKAVMRSRAAATAMRWEYPMSRLRCRVTSLATSTFASQTPSHEAMQYA
jgi:hypothetical protein